MSTPGTRAHERCKEQLSSNVRTHRRPSAERQASENARRAVIEWHRRRREARQP